MGMRESIPPRQKRRWTDPPKDNREPHQRDRDRILYNSAFRRLAGVTQVVAAEEGDVFHNRLTHSLKVAQFGRRLAEKIIREQPALVQAVGGIDPDVVESAGLAHDIGHPPFGHIAEKQLNQLAKSAGGFEGNAQSFRIVTQLALQASWNPEKARPEYPGLDLTRATLNAVLKYPWHKGGLHGKSHAKSLRKWGAYQSEHEDLSFARGLAIAEDGVKGAEASLMDWADDVTYSVHDMEDFYRAGLIPLDRLRQDEAERGRFYAGTFSREDGEAAESGFTRTELERSFEEIIEFVPLEEPYSGTQRQRCSLRNLTSQLIARYITAIELESTSLGVAVRIDPERRKEVLMWKELTWYYVITGPSLATQQHGQRKIISGLFEMFMDAADKKHFGVFPAGSRELMERYRSAGSGVDQELVRAIVDLIAGMTEQQAVRIYHRLTGVSLGSAFEPLLF